MEMASYLTPNIQDVERIMEDALANEDGRVYGMLIPFLKRGGKRIRPMLAIATCGAVGGDRKAAVEPASVIELFHNFTLIHDDIEDDSRYRRGEPTLQITHGIPIALNSGDALYTLLWRKLISIKMPPRDCSGCRPFMWMHSNAWWTGKGLSSPGYKKADSMSAKRSISR